jgi:hypothetical protein
MQAMGLTEPAALASSFQYRDSVVSGGTPVGTVVIKADPHRVAFTVSAGSGSIGIRPIGLSGPNVGYFLNGTTGFFQTFKFADLGGLVTMQWVISSPPAAGVNIAESIYYPLE